MFSLGKVSVLVCVNLCVQATLIKVPSDSDVYSCASNVFYKYVECGVDITLINFNLTDGELARRLHHAECYTVSSRDFHTFDQMWKHNQAYVIFTENVDELNKGLRYLTYERHWNPQGIFFIIAEILDNGHIQDLFNVFLNYHLDNVVLTGTRSVYQNEMFTYYPYENKACGRRLSRIVPLGNCRNLTTNPFYNKTPDNLNGCTFTILSHLSAPFTYQVDVNRTGILGIEEKIVSMLSELQDFRVEYVYLNTSKNYGEVLENNTMTGMFKYMDNGAGGGADALLGGVMLNENRIQRFDCISSYTMDRILVYVPRSGDSPKWTSLYEAFSTTVWLMILLVYLSILTLVIYTKIIVRRCRRNRHIRSDLRVFTIVYNNVLNASLWSNSVIYVTTLLWCNWTGWFLSGFYQTALASVMTQPGPEYQMDDLSEVLAAKYSLHIPVALLPYLKKSENRLFLKALRDYVECDANNCLQRVASGLNRFTLVTDIRIGNAQWRILNEKRNEKLHILSIPYFTFPEAIYLRRGFPLRERLQRQTLQIVASGFVNKCFRDVTHRENLDKFYSSNVEYKEKSVPITIVDTVGVFIVLLIGYIVSIIQFVRELNVHTVRS